MALLQKFRAYLIAKGKREAAILAAAHGSVHSRALRSRLVELGVLTPELQNRVGDYWLGAVFRGHLWEWTGDRFTYSDKERNIHERTVKVWRLKHGAQLPPEPDVDEDVEALLPADGQLNLFPERGGKS